MRNAKDPAEKSPKLKIVVAVVLLVAAGGAAWWAATKGEGEQFERAAICTQCGHECVIKVGAAAGMEDWPKECPACHQKHLYLFERCPNCGHPMPLMDPKTGGFGFPTTCPKCKALNSQSMT